MCAFQLYEFRQLVLLGVNQMPHYFYNVYTHYTLLIIHYTLYIIVDVIAHDCEEIYIYIPDIYTR